MQPVERKHILVLDGLRGIALISVIFVHANGYVGGPFGGVGIGKVFAGLFGCGWVGVDLFFVLSGFLITGILCDAKGSERFLRNFWARRALRIMPLYFAYLLLLIFVAYAKPGFLGITAVSDGSMKALGAYYYNFWVAFVTQSPTPQAHHFWSLAVEEHFYLVWPILVMLFSSRSLVKICFAGMLFALASRIAVLLGGLWVETAYLITPCRLDSLLAGGIVAIAFRDPTIIPGFQAWTKRIMIGSGFLLIGIFLIQGHFVNLNVYDGMGRLVVDSTVTITLGMTALSLFFAAMLACLVQAAPGGILQRILKAKWLIAVGRYSYAMYVFHLLILTFAYKVVHRFTPAVLSLPNYVANLLLVMLVLPLSYVTALASYHMFEKHFLRLKRLFVLAEQNRSSIREFPPASAIPVNADDDRSS